MSEGGGGAVHFAIPGNIDTPTGGYGYDRRLTAELPRHGWRVAHIALPDGFPQPTDQVLATAANQLGELPDGAVAMIDGLAFSAMPAVMRELARRLRLVALIHHPLADETGLPDALAARLLDDEREALRHARAVICTSATTAERLASGFGVDRARLTVAPPGAERHPQARGGNDPPIILSLAAVVPRKGHDVLIGALARLRERTWRCRIVGATDRDTTWVAHLHNLLRDAGLGDRVILAGPTANPDAEMRRADIFALPSRHEGYGMAFAEALAHGLPIVACAAGAVPEVVPPDAGMLVAVDDDAALGDALGALLGDMEMRRRMADAAWRAGQRLPGWDETARQVAKALEQVAR